MMSPLPTKHPATASHGGVLSFYYQLAYGLRTYVKVERQSIHLAFHLGDYLMNPFEDLRRRNLLTFAGLLMQGIGSVEGDKVTDGDRPISEKQNAARFLCEQWCKVMHELEQIHSQEERQLLPV